MKTLRNYLIIALLSILAMSCGGSVKGSTPAPTEPPANMTTITAKVVWSFNGGETTFFYPSGIAIDSQGNVYVTDTRNGRVVKIDPKGQFLSEFGSNGGGAGQFTLPAGVALDGEDNVYVADSGNHRIQKFDSNGIFLTMWGSFGNGEGQFSEPSNIAVDGQGQVFVVDRQNFNIQKFDSNGRFIASWGGKGEKEGQFVGIGFIAVDPQGNIYASDFQNNRLTMTRFDNSGQFLTKWEQLTCKFQRETVSPHEIGGAGGMWFDPQGSLYVADLSWGRICQFDPNGIFLGGWGEKGIEPGQFQAPIGVVGDGAGNIYVLDYSSGQVQKFGIK